MPEKYHEISPEPEKTLGERVMDTLPAGETTYTINPGTSEEKQLRVAFDHGYVTVWDGDQAVFEVSKIGAKPDGWVVIKENHILEGDAGTQYLRKGIAGFVHDLLDSQTKDVGGKGLMPQFAGLTEDGRLFWLGYLKKKYPTLDENFIDDLVTIPARVYDLDQPPDEKFAQQIYREAVYAKLAGGDYSMLDTAKDLLKKYSVTLRNIPEELRPSLD